MLCTEYEMHSTSALSTVYCYEYVNQKIDSQQINKLYLVYEKNNFKQNCWLVIEVDYNQYCTKY